jgi:hypothetical protein
MFVDFEGQFYYAFFQGIPCLCNETVMEVMWGLKNIMPTLVPEEKSELTREDRLPMSQGLKSSWIVMAVMSNQRW